MSNGAPVERAVSVWALADPSAINQNASAIEKAFRQALGAPDPTRHRITIAPGLIQHEDTRGLWHTAGASLPSAEEARTYAGEIIRKVTTALSPSGNQQLFQSLVAMELVPARVRPLDLLHVASSEGSGWDHWLVRSRPQLPLSAAGETADVFGALLEVRIGPAGAIYGYMSRWRPVLPDHVEVRLAPAPPPPSQGQSSTTSQQGEPPILYVLEGETTPQFYLAPYWPGEDAEDLTLSSGCELSLVVSIVPYSKEDPTLYAAVVDGGSGQYRFDWGMLPWAEYEEGSLVELGEGEIVSERSTEPPSVFSVMKIPAGAHLILVNAVDVKTGGFQHHSEQVYVAEPSDSSTAVV